MGACRNVLSWGGVKSKRGPSPQQDKNSPPHEKTVPSYEKKDSNKAHI